MKRICAALSLLLLTACGGLPSRFPDTWSHDQPDPDADACRAGNGDACYRAGERWGGFARLKYPKSRRDQPFAGGLLEKGCELEHGGCCGLLAELLLFSTLHDGPYETRDGINYALEVMEKGCKAKDLKSCDTGQRLRSPSSSYPGKTDRDEELMFAKMGCALGSPSGCKLVKGDAFVATNFGQVAKQYMSGVKKEMGARNVVKQLVATTPAETNYSRGGTVSVMVWDPSKQLREVCFILPATDLLAKAYGGQRDQKACTTKRTSIAGGTVVGGQLPWFLRPGATSGLEITTTPSDLKVVISIIVPN